MKRWIIVLLLALMLLGIAPVARGQETMQKLYLIPVEQVGMSRGPMYFCWQMEPVPDCIACSWSMMDYGFTNSALLVAKNITQEQHDGLVAHSDVFEFPDNLDGPVDQDIQAFFEGIHLPTDWLTPSTTWRELLRQVAGMMQFNQRYGGIAANETGELHSIFDTATLDTRLREMTTQEQAWFLATVASFGYDPNLVPTNARLRQLVKVAGDYWAGQSFYLGGWEF
jgi:hypothetical protein